MTVSVSASKGLPPLWQAIEDLHERRDPGAFLRAWTLLAREPDGGCTVHAHNEDSEETVGHNYRATILMNSAGELERVIELRWVP